MATISISRDELMAKLVEAKARADRDDAKTAKQHASDEKSALVKFREALRTALKWDYETFKNKGCRGLSVYAPRCPIRSARRIEIAIEQLKMDTRKGRLRLSDKSDWFMAATWMPESDRPKNTVCD